MAAPSSKPSPSGQPVASSADSANANIKPESEAPATIATAPSTTTETSAAATVATVTSATAASHSPQQQQQQEEEEEPSYQSSQASTDYAAAKALLNQGAFEDALSQIEQGIANTRHRLLSSSSSSFPKTEDEITFHPALAPFHYLYGTTLLYSVEESSDTMGLTNTTTNTAAAGSSSSAGNDGDAAAAANHHGEQGGADDDDDDNVEDIQIAWENLDLARTILERMMASSSNNNKNATPTGSSDNEYALDLAQVYLRQGDLHKMNGRYESAVADYQACLKYRTQKLSTCPFDRRIADAHYNLALSHMMLVAEQRQQQQRPDADDTNNTAPTTTTTTTPSLSPAALKEHRERSIYHYLECARTFGGLLAILCHQDPNEFFQKLETDNGDVGTANLKTTGEEEEEGQDTTSSNNNNLDGDASRQVVKLRQHVQQHLQPPTADDDLQTKAEFEEICQLLTEIQETIDEAENSVKGVHQVAEMKAEISAAAAASVDDGNNNNNKEGQQQDAFGSSAAAASTAVAQTILAVKKKPKNKRPSAIVGAQDEATKRPKSAE